MRESVFIPSSARKRRSDTMRAYPESGQQLPRGWSRARLDDVARRASGHTPSQAKPQYWNGGIKWVSLADSGNLDCGYISETDKEISALGIRHSSAVLLPAETVIVSRDAGVGRSAVLKTEMAVSQHFIAWSCRPTNKLDPWFLYAWLQIRKPFFERMAVGSTIKTIGLPVFKRLTIDFPSLAEQRKIAEILRTWDEALYKLASLRSAILQRRAWLRSHLLTGQTRLPGYTKQWETMPLSAVLKQHRQTSTGAEEVNSVSLHKGLVNQIEHLGRSFAAAETGHYNRVLPGDIVYTKSPTGDFPLGIIKQSRVDRPVIVSPLYGVFTPITWSLGVILDAYFESPVTVRNYLHPLVQKGAKNTIGIMNIRFLEGRLPLPTSESEQAAIAEVIETSRVELDLIDAEIDALTCQKRGLMQKLLTGEWRVQLHPTDPNVPIQEVAHAEYEKLLDSMAPGREVGSEARRFSSGQ